MGCICIYVSVSTSSNELGLRVDSKAEMRLTKVIAGSFYDEGDSYWGESESHDESADEDND